MKLIFITISFLTISVWSVLGQTTAIILDVVPITSQRTVPFQGIQINPGRWVLPINPEPIVPLRTEPVIVTIPPCLLDCPPPPVSITSCRGRTTIFIDGVKIRSTPRPPQAIGAAPVYKGISLDPGGISADQGNASVPLKSGEAKQYVLTSRTYAF